MPIEHKLERADRPDHPNRCQAIAGYGQCPYLAAAGAKNCVMHGGHSTLNAAKKVEQRNYQLAQWRQRVGEFADNPKVKSLREEIGITRLMLETIVNKCTDDTDILMYSTKMSDLVTRIEKLVTSCHRLEASTGQLMDKTAALHFASQIIEIISRIVPDADQVDQVSNEILIALAQLNTKPEVE